jgi:hypothetical protein
LVVVTSIDRHIQRIEDVCICIRRKICCGYKLMAAALMIGTARNLHLLSVDVSIKCC